MPTNRPCSSDWSKPKEFVGTLDNLMKERGETMNWRIYQTHREETAAVKKHLQGQGYNVLKVNHHRGTAWGWLRVYVQISRPEDCYCHKIDGNCNSCHEVWRKTYIDVGREVREITGRHGDHDGEILIKIEIGN